ncbi:organic hydroperoxide resistance protein [Saccharothrix sp. NRRL B-16348]|jgi:Ohr subfamily peroxiredoxin|uniref:organic hydroperoxide resistance protein n=1 Tax=Saccharothrix sp. NRRL B-16348 TaxID=1415542 RepID=UPI0006AFAC99|nr:organic hydroperoxide resistance protein [Saccharothrix sp. NRRL B-16348]KOX32500.1 organic hydroperoxide resistance protein [Saccharothrix sp. NRRL B-16348]
MQVLYTAEAIAVGDGRNGEVRSSDGVIDEQLSTPKELGGPGGDRTNPEQLFAAGYAACFHSALKVAARQAKVTIGETSVTAKVDLGPNGSGGFELAVELAAHIPGVEQDVAERLAAAAHQICPYSNATRGNIEVALTTTV